MKSALKARREELRMTQKDLAEYLGVSQQTVARWESSDQIPTKHLREVVVKLGMSVGDFIRDESAPRNTPTMQFPEAPFGALELSIAGQTKCYPTGWSQVSSAFESLESIFKPVDSWIQIETLDQRVLYINTQSIDAVRWINDDEEEMPSFEHEEVYKAAEEILGMGTFTDVDVDSESFPYTRDIVSSVKELIEERGEIETYKWLTRATYLTVDGKTGTANVNTDLICALDDLAVSGREPKHFIDLTSYEESIKLLPARSLALVEVPYLQMAKELQRMEEE